MNFEKVQLFVRQYREDTKYKRKDADLHLLYDSRDQRLKSWFLQLQ